MHFALRGRNRVRELLRPSAGACIVRAVAEVLETRAMLAAQPYTWNNAAFNGGGFVDGLVFSPTQRNLLYARTDVGGAYRWNAANGSWIPLNDALGRNDSQLTGVLSIATDPSNPNNVYEAVGQYTPSWGQNAAILYSSDQGNTWGRANLPFKLGGNEDGRGAGERLQVDPNNGNNLLLGTTKNGLWKSSDSGHSWSLVNGFSPASTTFVLYDKRSATPGNATQTIYVGVNSLTGTNLYRSTDGGTTWGAIPGAPTAGMLAYQASMDSTGMLYVSYDDALGPNGASKGAVWKLDTNTGAWANVTPPAGQGGFAGVSVDTQHPGTVIVTTLDRWYTHDQIYRTTNGGASWTSLWDNSTTFDTSSAPWAATNTPHWLADVEIDPFNSAHVLFGTGYGIFSSTNATNPDIGQPVKWVFDNKGLEETVPLGLISPQAGSHLLTVVGDFDGFRSDDLTVSGVRYNPRVGTSSGIDYAQNNPNLVVRTGGSGSGFYSQDGGINWTAFASKPAGATGGGKIAVSADGLSFVWSPAGAAVSYSKDKGATWTASAGIPAGLEPVADRGVAGRFYSYDPNSGNVYVSNDGGATFNIASNLPQKGGALRTPFGQPGEVWAPTGSGLYRSTNAGAGFFKITTVQQAYLVGFGATAPGSTYPAVFLFGQVGNVVGLFRSDDVGATWTQINDSQHQFGWLNAISGDPRVYGRVYLATGGRGVVFGDLIPANEPPSVATPASATPGGVTGTSTALSVLGADDAGEASLNYSWSAINSPPAPVSFSAVDTNAAKNVTATFSKAGTYTLRAIIRDSKNFVTFSDVTVVVSPTLNGATISPDAITLGQNQTQQFVVNSFDQFGQSFTPTAGYSWSLVGHSAGAITAGGLFSAGAAGAGNATVQAISAGVSASADIVISNSAPTILNKAAASAASVIGKTTTLSVLGADDAGESGLRYVWATTGVPPAPVNFSTTDTNAAKSVIATFTKAGTYDFIVTARDAGGLTATSTVQVVVNSVLSSLVVSPAIATIRLSAKQQFVASARDQFGATMTTPAGLVWSIASGGGSVTSAGLYTASTTAGTASVSVKSGAIVGKASISVIAPSKLAGSAIGTSGSRSNLGNTISKTFDGSLSTYFDAPAASGAWVGLNLGSARTITQLKFAPRSGYTSRMTGGYFQVSNVANFSTATKIYTITSAPAAGTLKSVNATVAGTWKYIRYVGPANSYTNIAELQVWGY